MKKIYAGFLFILTIAGAAQAQLNSGQLLVAGNIGYEYRHADIRDFSHFKLSPSIGVFVANKLATGVRIGFDRYRSKFDFSQYSSRSSSIIFSPFARYYLLSASKNYNLFIDGAFDFHRVKNVYSTTSKEHGRGFSISAGPVIFITPQIATELGFGYSKKKIEANKTTTLFTTLGFQYHFRKK